MVKVEIAVIALDYGKRFAFLDFDFQGMRQAATDGYFLNAQILRQATLHDVRLQPKKLFAHVDVADFHDVFLRNIFCADEFYFAEREERHVHEKAEHRRAHDEEN